jgi:coiled-coil domain-containing protein 130
MSSLAATGASGYYVPPEYYESGAYRKFSPNEWQQRQKGNGKPKADSRALVRFELPTNGICEGCKSYISKGTRFNAEKRKVDMYLSTPILEFSMTCRSCARTEFRIRTNPQKRGFNYVEGIQKSKAHTLEAARVAEDHAEVAEGDERDALDRLEAMARGKRKTVSELDHLRALQAQKGSFLHDSDLNASLRTSFRGERKLRKRRLADAEKRGWRKGMELVEAQAEDAEGARQITYGNSRQLEDDQFRRVRTSSIFSKKHKTKLRGVGEGEKKKYKLPHTASTRPDDVSFCAEALNSHSLPRGQGEDPQHALVKKESTRLTFPEQSRRAICGTRNSGFIGLKSPSGISSGKWSALSALADYQSDSD